MANATPNDLVPFQRASSPLEAELIAGILRGAGIPAYIDGNQLNDEFAISQRVLGMNAVRVQVQRMHLADAEAALAEAREAGADLEEAAASAAPAAGSAAPAPARPRQGFWLPVLLAGAAVTFLVQWLDARAALRDVQANALTYFDENATGAGVWRWRATDNIAGQHVDADGNGVAERSSQHNLAGLLLHTSYDADQDGMWEKTESFDARGVVVARAFDRDEDGVMESFEEERAGQRKLVFLDVDQDRRVDRIEEHGAQGVVRVWAWDDARGFQAK